MLIQQDFPPNSDITKLTNLSRAPVKAYSSVQHGVGPNDHFELNSDLLFSEPNSAAIARGPARPKSNGS